jgi:repressor LexA
VTNPPSDEKLRRLEQAIGFKEGELLAQAHLQRTPSDVRAILQNLLQQAEAASNTVPLINAISAGYPTAFMDLSYPRRVAGEYVSGPEVQDRDAFAVRVVGNNMSPKYDEGDIVIFSPALPARSGDDCFVRFRDGTTTFKRVFLEGGQSSGPVWRLQTRCQAPPPQEIVSEDVIDLYRAVYRYQKVDGNT